ncbi:MAG: helix-turn-helix domain-containing protein [Elusimicrobia bacterium]|nr:helix-turn-helix domain-containing protein [Elusimicrobiota bacterium]
MVRAVRLALRMTQAQLAKRAGIPQSHIARIETAKVDLQLSTLRKVFRALFCELLVLPRMQRSIEDAIAARAKEKARQNVARVTGTMALESQRPDDETIGALIRSEENRLLSNPSSELWEG